MDASMPPQLRQYLLDPATVKVLDSGIPGCDLPMRSLGFLANQVYFSNSKWTGEYFKYCHRSKTFKDRWRRVIKNWDGLIVVDIGCGPGNVFASLGGKPAFLLGIDIADGALRMAESIGYTPLRVDAHSLPLISAFADVVAMNATIHHCDDMAAVLTEGARLVKPGGMLITDHDPHRSAYDFSGLGLALWRVRIPAYRWFRIAGHRDYEAQKWMLAGEIHHDAGDGMTEEEFHRVLEPMGFDVQVYRHNNGTGAEALDGVSGRAEKKMRLAQRLSGIDPDSASGAITLMCVAKRRI
jgi:SAM-dependent methyltransferase